MNTFTNSAESQLRTAYSAFHQRALLRRGREMVALMVLSGLICGVVGGILWEEVRTAGEGNTPPQQVATAETRPQSNTAHHRAAALVQQIEYQATDSLIKVNIDLQSAVRFEAHSLHDPERIFIDLHGARLGPQLPPKITVEQAGLRRIRLAQNEPQKSRIVLDLSAPFSYSVTPAAGHPGFLVELRKQTPSN